MGNRRLGPQDGRWCIKNMLVNRRTAVAFFLFWNFIGQGEVVETELPGVVSLASLGAGNESNGTTSKLHDWIKT